VTAGSRAFVTETKERLGVKHRGRKLVGTGESCESRESAALYDCISGHVNEALRLKNEYFGENSI
jgi:hypothetical protein